MGGRCDPQTEHLRRGPLRHRRLFIFLQPGVLGRTHGPTQLQGVRASAVAAEPIYLQTHITSATGGQGGSAFGSGREWTCLGIRVFI